MTCTNSVEFTKDDLSVSKVQSPRPDRSRSLISSESSLHREARKTALVANTCHEEVSVADEFGISSRTASSSQPHGRTICRDFFSLSRLFLGLALLRLC